MVKRLILGALKQELKAAPMGGTNEDKLQKWAPTSDRRSSIDGQIVASMQVVSSHHLQDTKCCT